MATEWSYYAATQFHSSGKCEDNVLDWTNQMLGREMLEFSWSNPFHEWIVKSDFSMQSFFRVLKNANPMFFFRDMHFDISWQGGIGGIFLQCSQKYGLIHCFHYSSCRNALNYLIGNRLTWNLIWVQLLNVINELLRCADIKVPAKTDADNYFLVMTNNW